MTRSLVWCGGLFLLSALASGCPTGTNFGSTGIRAGTYYGDKIVSTECTRDGVYSHSSSFSLPVVFELTDDGRVVIDGHEMTDGATWTDEYATYVVQGVAVAADTIIVTQSYEARYWHGDMTYTLTRIGDGTVEFDESGVEFQDSEDMRCEVTTLGVLRRA